MSDGRRPAGSKRRWVSLGAKLLLPLAIIAGALLVAGYLQATKPEVQADPPQERVWAVETISVEKHSIQPVRRYYGEVVAGRRADIRAEVAGTVLETGDNFVEGGIVREGELLLRIDDFAFNQAVKERAAELTEARARKAEIEADIDGAQELLETDEQTLAIRRREVERRRKLQGKGHVSETSLDDSQLQLNQAQQALIDRRNQIARLKATQQQQIAKIVRLESALERAQRDLEDATITAPFTGFLMDADTAAGKFVGVGDTTARLIKADRLEARFHIPTDHFARMRGENSLIGQTVRVRWRGDTGVEPYAAVIDRVEAQVSAASGGVELFARLQDIDADTSLRPGAFVEVLMEDVHYEDVVRVPDRAVHGDRVYVVEGEAGRLEAREVSFVTRIGDDILLRGEFDGITGVVVTRIPEMGPGMRVSVK